MNPKVGSINQEKRKTPITKNQAWKNGYYCQTMKRL